MLPNQNQDAPFFTTTGRGEVVQVHIANTLQLNLKELTSMVKEGTVAHFDGHFVIVDTNSYPEAMSLVSHLFEGLALKLFYDGRNSIYLSN